MVEVMAAGVDGAADLVRGMPGVADTQVFGERLHVTLDGVEDGDVTRFAAALGTTRLAGAPLRGVSPTLEDVFIAKLTAKEAASAR
jgi:hypothetical protein